MLERRGEWETMRGTEGGMRRSERQKWTRGLGTADRGPRESESRSPGIGESSGTCGVQNFIFFFFHIR